MNSILAVVKSNYKIIFLLFISTLLVYFNFLNNEFAVVDDLATYVNNETIRSLSKSLKTLNIQNIEYSILYSIFKDNPLPLRIIALFNHFIASVLVFFVIKKLFNKKTAGIAALLFVAHPVNSEAINWISGNFYIVETIVLLICILVYLKYIELHNIKYLYILVSIIGASLLLIQTPWIFIIPLAIIVIDICFVKKKIDYKFIFKFFLYLLPILFLYFIFQFKDIYSNRVSYRTPGGTHTLNNQQALTPVIEGYPYTVYSMARLYIFPKDLTIYYDGNVITTVTYVLMYSVFAVYCLLTIYFYLKNKKVAGLLLLLIVLLAPVFSPQKITWFIAERYLYFGTGFFTALIAVALLLLEKKFKFKNFTLYISLILFIVFSIRTYLRSNDWQNPETLALATIKTSPLSVRPYNDLGGYYLLQNRVEDAKNYYKKAFEVGGSITSVRNLGYIYLSTGFDTNLKTTHEAIESLINKASISFENKDYRSAAYYINEALIIDDKNINLLNLAAQVLIEIENYEQALSMLNKSLEVDENNPNVYYALGYLEFKRGKPKFAVSYLNKVLELDPTHEQAKTNLEYINTHFGE